ncbi:vWA domain-containing protein [Planctomycetaceae bacterium SH139]
MLVFIVMLMAGFIAAAALMIGVAQMQLARTELRTATDAAAKAAAQQLSLSQDRGEAIAVARRVAAENLVNNEPLLLANGDLEFGRSLQDASGTFVFRINQTPINSVRVVGRRTAGSPSGAIPFFMGDLLTSGSFEPVQSAIATYIERDVVLVIDRSGSMQGRKFRDLTSAINIFTQTLRETPVEERVGLASYSTNSRRDVGLTTNLSQIDGAVQGMSVGGLTSISAGMMDGRTIMQNSRSAEFVERTMIVMTDGLHNRGPEPRGIARQLAGEGVVIHTITFGNTADRNRMQEIAAIGRGRFFHAVNGNQLRQIYREIALTLSTIITE